MSRVVVVGAGVSGLAAAFRIRQACPDSELVVLDKNPRPGGNVWTEHRDGFTVEFGPNGLLDAKPQGVQLCRDLGLGERLIPASEAARKNRFLYLNGRLHQLPASPLGILTTPVLSLRGRLTLLAEPFRRRPKNVPEDESVAAFARRRFGREAAETFVDALVTGIHAGDPEQLSVAAAFPRLPRFEAEAGSVVRGFLRTAKQRRREAEARGEPPPGPPRMWSFREGLRILVETLVDRLGTAVQLGVDVQQIERTSTGWTVHSAAGEAWSADAVVLTSPAYHQAELLAGLDVHLAQEIGTITYNRIAVVALGYRREQVGGPQDGFGYLAPQNTRRDVLGVQWCSSVFPDRAPSGYVLWRALCGGVHRADVLDWDDETLVRRVHHEMTVTMGVTGEPVFRQVVRWPRAIPQYVVGHLARVNRIEAAARAFPGLFLGGNAYHGVALNDCAEQAERLAAGVVRLFRGKQ
jgi:oxygen-dependent protoporphyrinogen oxidase